MRTRPRRVLDGRAELSCKVCSRWLPESDFYLRRGKWHHSWCKDCVTQARFTSRRYGRSTTSTWNAWLRVPL